MKTQKTIHPAQIVKIKKTLSCQKNTKSENGGIKFLIPNITTYEPLQLLV